MSNFLINSDFNNQKILIDEVIVAAAWEDTLVIDHGLGYIPVAKVWYEAVPGQWFPSSTRQYTDGFSGGGSGVYVEKQCVFMLSTTQCIVEVRDLGSSGLPTNVHVRIYLDD